MSTRRICAILCLETHHAHVCLLLEISVQHPTCTVLEETSEFKRTSFAAPCSGLPRRWTLVGVPQICATRQSSYVPRAQLASRHQIHLYQCESPNILRQTAALPSVTYPSLPNAVYCSIPTNQPLNALHSLKELVSRTWGGTGAARIRRQTATAAHAVRQYTPTQCGHLRQS